MSITTETKKISVEDGLHLIGAKFSPRGATQAQVNVRMNMCEIKRYAVRRRVGDGHTVFRWGRLVSCEATYYSDAPDSPVVIFIPERFA